MHASRLAVVQSLDPDVGPQQPEAAAEGLSAPLLPPVANLLPATQVVNGCGGRGSAYWRSGERRLLPSSDDSVAASLDASIRGCVLLRMPHACTVTAPSVRPISMSDAEGASWHSLDRNLISHIVSLLDSHTDLCALQRTCRDVRLIVNENALWLPRLQESFGLRLQVWGVLRLCRSLPVACLTTPCKAYMHMHTRPAYHPCSGHRSERLGV